MRVELQPAFVLHTRNYRDTSLLVEWLTPDYGRVSSVVRGVRSTGKAAKQKRSLIQPFIPLLISWSGNTDLKTLIHCEPDGPTLPLSGKRLFSGMYVNELMTRLMHHYDAHPEIFDLYRHTLINLLDVPHIDVVLRQYELSLLDSLGYAISLCYEASSGDDITAKGCYRLQPDLGFVAVSDNRGGCSGEIYQGEELLAIAAADFSEPVRRTARRLCRALLQVHLGGRPLKSRELFS